MPHIEYISKNGRHFAELKGISQDRQTVYVKRYGKAKEAIPIDHVVECYKKTVLEFANGGE